MAENMPQVSIVVPVYMEQDVLVEFYNRLKALLSKIEPGFSYEIIFVNDGSTDRTGEILKEIGRKDSTVKTVSFSRNFGHQVAITAGIDHAAGDAVIVMDADLQDPPEIIPQLMSKWREGYQVVYCVRSKRKGEGRLKLLTAALFYKIMANLSDTTLPLSSGDFRLMDRKVVNVLKGMSERNRYVRGLVAWIGFSQIALQYERDARYAGTPKYNLRKSSKLAIDRYKFFRKTADYFQFHGNVDHGCILYSRAGYNHRQTSESPGGYSGMGLTHGSDSIYRRNSINVVRGYGNVSRKGLPGNEAEAIVYRCGKMRFRQRTK